MSDDSPELKVKFEQTITVHPPDFIGDKVDAHKWFMTNPVGKIYDAVDLNKGNIEVLEIND